MMYSTDYISGKGERHIKNQHYDAFISYRHSELDNEVAVGIHRRLEAFSLPRNLRKQFPKERHRIRRVFRDEDELPLAENLTDPIDQALRNSDWLIVICTPRLKESLWCAKEVELFSKYHGQEHILCVLAEGEPAESFPEKIRYREKTIINKHGKEETVREEIEPLAADVRALTKGGRKRKMDDAILRMVAPMYGLGYDDLKQRHREQRARRIAAVSGLAAAVFLVYAVTSTVLALRINDQKKTIEEQHETLQEQYYQQQVKYAESMSLVSGQLLSEGQTDAAIYAVRSVMPDQESDTSVPYIPSCQYALSNALGIYEAGEFLPDSVSEMPAESFWQDAGSYGFLNERFFDGNGYQVMIAQPFEDHKILVVGSNAHLYLYDEDTQRIADWSLGLYADIPSRNVNAAAYRDEELYLNFTQSGEMISYRWKSCEDYEDAGTIALTEYWDSRGDLLNLGEHKETDDGEYIVERGLNNTIGIYDKTDTRLKHPIKTIYDLHGGFYTMRALPGTEYHILIFTGKYSYLLNADFDIIARVGNFYDYSEEKQAFILFKEAPDATSYELYYMPLLSYDEIIELADERMEDYQPGDAMQERYQMLPDH